MTTNNPPIAAWAPSTALAKLASRHNNSSCVLTDGPAEFNDVALVRLSDYQRLQAAYEEELFQVRQTRDTHFGEMMRAIEQVDALQSEVEKLRKHLQNLIDQTTPLEPVPGNPMWSRRIQLDEVMAERDQLRVECEKLRSAMIEAKSYIEHYMYGGSIYREPAAEAIAIIDAAMEAKP